MILYSNTFENIKTLDSDFPIEDKYYTKDNVAVVADGITRDPQGILDLSSTSFAEMLKLYPRPSGAEMAAQVIVDSFEDFDGNLEKQMSIANNQVKILNDRYIKKCDYLQNDYYGAVASAVFIDGNILHYSYICDCGVIVYDKDKKIKFKTADDKEELSDPYINKIGIPWHLPEARVIVRRDFRNSPNNIQDGKCVSYGAFTGEKEAEKFIKSGELTLIGGDIIIVYTDGFANYLGDGEFIELVFNFDSKSFERYIEEKAKTDYNKYGKEKTLVIMKK